MSTPALCAQSASTTSACSSDWLGTLIVGAKAMAGIGECLPFPFVKGLFSTSVVLLELIEKVGTNEDDLRDLAKSVFASIKVIHDELQAHGGVSAPRFEAMCKEFTKDMDEIASDLAAIQRHKPGFRKRFKKYLMASSTTCKISNCQRHMNELRTNFALGMAAGMRLELSNVQQGVVAIRSDISSLARRIGNPTLSHDNFRTFMEGDIYLLSATRTVSMHKYDSEGRSITQGVAADYRACIGERSAVKTVRVFQGKSAQDLWANTLAFHTSLPRHPALAQLFGMCPSPRFQALVFHQDLVLPDEYAMTLPTAVAKVNFEGNLLNDYQSTTIYLRAAGFQNPDVSEHFFVNRITGRLCVSHLPDNYDTYRGTQWETLKWLKEFVILWCMPWLSPTDYPCHLSPAPSSLGSHRGKIPLLMDYYHALAPLGRPNAHWYPDPRVGDVYLHTDSKQEGRRLAHIPHPAGLSDPVWNSELISQAPSGGGWTRFSVPLTSGLYGGFTKALLVNTNINSSNRRDILSSWLAQAHHIFAVHSASNHGWDLGDIFLVTGVVLTLTWQLVSPFDPFSLVGTFMVEPSVNIPDPELPDQVFVFIEDPPVHDGYLGLPRMYWETEPPTAKVEMLQTGGYTARASARFIAYGYYWKPHHYHALRDFHRECGIDPDSDEAARLLDLPLAQLPSVPVPEKWEDSGWPQHWEIHEELGPHSLLDRHKYSEFKPKECPPINPPNKPCDVVATKSLDHEDDSQSESQDEALGSMSNSNSLEHNDPPTDNSPLPKNSIVAEYPAGGYTLPHSAGNRSLSWTWITVLIIIPLIFGKWGVIPLLSALFVHRTRFHEGVSKIWISLWSVALLTVRSDEL